MEQHETALIKVGPAVDPRMIALYEEGISFKQDAEAMVILSDSDISRATDHLSIIAKLKKAIEEKRKEYIGPLNDHLKAINETFKRFVSPIERADAIVREKVVAYRKEQERIRLEQERINRLRAEAAQAEMKLKGELMEPVTLVPVVPVEPTGYSTAAGTLGTTHTRKWEVDDLKLVPIEYLVIDATKVGKVVRAGIPSIPGIRIWVEEGLRITSQ